MSVFNDPDVKRDVHRRRQIFGNNLAWFRKSKLMTQVELAEAIGVRPPTVSGYETGFNEPSLEILCRISNVLDVSTDCLLGLSLMVREEARNG